MGSHVPPKYEEDKSTKYWVMVHFIHYVPVWLDLWPNFPKIGSRDPNLWWIYLPIWKFIHVSFLKYEAIHCRFSGPVARQPALSWQPFCASLVWWGVILILAPKYAVDVTTHNGVMARFTCIHYMPVWPRSLTYLHQNWVMWPGPYVEDICIFEVYRPLRLCNIRS